MARKRTSLERALDPTTPGEELIKIHSVSRSTRPGLEALRNPNLPPEYASNVILHGGADSLAILTNPSTLLWQLAGEKGFDELSMNVAAFRAYQWCIPALVPWVHHQSHDNKASLPFILEHLSALMDLAHTSWVTPDDGYDYGGTLWYYNHAMVVDRASELRKPRNTTDVVLAKMKARYIQMILRSYLGIPLRSYVDNMAETGFALKGDAKSLVNKKAPYDKQVYALLDPYRTKKASLAEVFLEIRKITSKPTYIGPFVDGELVGMMMREVSPECPGLSELRARQQEGD